MSELYIIEPPTSGKVIIETNYGNIDIELFTREAPKSCKNFIQHCLNKYYNGCIFFKIFKNFMIQTGDPTNTGNGGESIFSEDFRDEFHSRLKFSHRGIVAMANKNKPNTNGSQFFITLDKCEEMNRKFTIFGKVTGPTFFNAVNISNLSADEDGYPIMNNDEKPKIINTEVVINPFSELKPTVIIDNENKNSGKTNKKNKNKNKKLKIKYTTDKMFFNDEENEDEKINKNINQEKNNNEKDNDNKGNMQKNENKENIEKKSAKKDEEDNNDEQNIEKGNSNIENEENKDNNDINDKKENKNDEKKENEIIDKNENKDKDNKIIEEKEEEEESEKTFKKDKKEKKDNDNNGNEEEDNENENNENSESESKSLSSDDNVVQNAKQLLDDDEDNMPKNKKKNIDDYKREINLLRKKIKREKEEQYNEDELRKKVEEEKINKMNILQKYNYDYVKSKQANKLSTDERANKLKNFKSFIGGGDSDGWYKTRLKFQTDSQKAFALDMINKELEKNEN